MQSREAVFVSCSVSRKRDEGAAEPSLVSRSEHVESCVLLESAFKVTIWI